MRAQVRFCHTSRHVIAHTIFSLSMGGLLAADTLMQLYDTRPDTHAPLWPRVIALIAFDTPVSQSFHASPFCVDKPTCASQSPLNGILMASSTVPRPASLRLPQPGRTGWGIFASRLQSLAVHIVSHRVSSSVSWTSASGSRCGLGSSSSSSGGGGRFSCGKCSGKAWR
jgi:uncharacterized membrane protein YgcG